MTTTAEAAGLSRVTLHRIERGEPAVTIGAYLNVITALGWHLTIAESAAPRASETATVSATPTHTAATVRIGDYPQLRQIAWQLGDDTELTESEALNLYERNWRHIDHSATGTPEHDFIKHLVDTWGNGRLLV